jgi:predicted alpha/beta superfamily hydrolase
MVEHIKIHGTALEGNLEGDAVDRDVIVFLPPSYAQEKRRRYPVVYALHGFSIGAEQWTHEIHVPQTPVILLYDLRIPVRTQQVG